MNEQGLVGFQYLCESDALLCILFLYWSDSGSDNLRMLLRTIYRVIKGKYYFSVTSFIRNHDILQAASWIAVLFLILTIKVLLWTFDLKRDQIIQAADDI